MLGRSGVDWVACDIAAQVLGLVVVENGLITPTLKIKRTELARQFAPEIAQLYGQRPEAAERLSGPPARIRA